MKPPHLVLALVCAAGSAAGCMSRQVDCSDATVHRFLHDNITRYEDSIRQASRWLMALHVDPVELQLRGEKGKKHYVEILDAFSRLQAVALGPEREISDRLFALARYAEHDEFHDMAFVDDRTFKQGATSYLRAALLLDRLNFDITRYREEIRAIAPRLDAHLADRGVHQRLVFAWYYAWFDLDEPFDLMAAQKEGLIARRAPPQTMSKLDAYSLTHEVFSPYEFGEDLDADPFDIDAKRYLSETLSELLADALRENDVDLTAELVSSMRYLRFTDQPIYQRGLIHLFDHQNPDGSWGTYAAARARKGDLVDQTHVLHTTAVAVDALTVAFHPAWNKDVAPLCLRP